MTRHRRGALNLSGGRVRLPRTLRASMAVSGLIAAADNSVVAGLDAGDLIALLALCVSAGSAWFSWHAWRRSPGSDIELRQRSVRLDEKGVSGSRALP